MSKPQVNLSAAVNVHNGKAFTLVEGGTVPVYAIGGLEGYTDKSICDEPCIAIGAAGTIGRVRRLDPPYWITGTQIYLTAKLGWDIDCIWEFFEGIHWQYFTNSYAIPPKLDQEMLLNVAMPAFCVESQQKIGRIYRLYRKQRECFEWVPDALESCKKDIFAAMFNGGLKFRGYTDQMEESEEVFKNPLYDLPG